MRTYVYYKDVFLEKQKFNKEQDENYSLQFVKILLIFFALFLAWNIYSHCKQVESVNNGTLVLAQVSTSRMDKVITYTATDGNTYRNRVPGILLMFSDDTATVYYTDDPADATPLLSPYFFYATYAISVVCIFICLRKIIRNKKRREI